MAAHADESDAAFSDQAPGEASAFRWAADREVADLMDQAYAVRVLDALSGDHLPAVRHHDGVHLL
jgi:8-oxo-dGTP diphosphatase